MFSRRTGRSAVCRRSRYAWLQIRVDFTNAMVIVRGVRPGEKPGRKQGMHWGTDHFGLKIQGDFDGLCSELKKKGVVFTMEPKDVNPATRPHSSRDLTT